ncbi:ABC transporter permease [Pseudomonas sp. SMN5]|uniref:ABC transporter permease n=1 Tax=Pseudomonas sp. SMN5 TaxID=3390198 RepID=UPI003F836280
MQQDIIFRSAKLAILFLKEQFKEPTALLWTIISPSLFYYLLRYTSDHQSKLNPDYVEDSAWFYAYIASSVGLFGFSLYIIGRRESGFVRSFIYSKASKIVFLTAQFSSYSLIAVIYCCTFYLLTKTLSGELHGLELLTIATRFYACFLIFCSIGLLLTLLPLTFQNSSTLFSIILFAMIALGFANPIIEGISYLNPLQTAANIMRAGLLKNIEVLAISGTTLIATLLLSMKYLRINPIWSRY